MPYCYIFLSYINLKTFRNKTLNNKNLCEIKYRSNFLNRMPIETRGLVQLSFIHNLI